MYPACGHVYLRASASLALIFSLTMLSELFLGVGVGSSQAFDRRRRTVAPRPLRGFGRLGRSSGVRRPTQDPGELCVEAGLPGREAAQGAATFKGLLYRLALIEPRRSRRAELPDTGGSKGVGG